jgi:hypothetical protein
MNKYLIVSALIIGIFGGYLLGKTVKVETKTVSIIEEEKRCEEARGEFHIFDTHMIWKLNGEPYRWDIYCEVIDTEKIFHYKI